MKVGAKVGVKVGAMLDGTTLGCTVGALLGEFEGAMLDGTALGCTVGESITVKSRTLLSSIGGDVIELTIALLSTCAFFASEL